MARIFTSGFELGTTTTGMEWSAFSGGSVQTGVVRSGTYAYRVSGLASGTSQRVRQQFASAAANGPYHIRVYVRFATLPSAQNRFFYLSSSTTQNSSVRAYLTIDNTGAVRLFDDVGQIGSASAPVSTGTFHRVEVLFNRTGANGAHILRSQVNGIEFAAATNRTIGGGVSQLYVGGNLALEAQTVGDWAFDDIAINDGTGSFQNNYPGAGSILHLKPNAAGDSNAWTNDYTAVDEVTPDDATSIQQSNTLNQVSDHNIEPTPSAMQSYDIVSVVAINARFAGSSSSNSSFVLRCKASSGGTVEEGTATTPTSAAYRTNDPGGTIFTPRLTMYNMPGASTSLWTKSDLDVAQIGYRVSTALTNPARVSTIWMMIDYAPGTPPPPPSSVAGYSLLSFFD